MYYITRYNSHKSMLAWTLLELTTTFRHSGQCQKLPALRKPNDMIKANDIDGQACEHDPITSTDHIHTHSHWNNRTPKLHSPNAISQQDDMALLAVTDYKVASKQLTRMLIADCLFPLSLGIWHCSCDEDMTQTGHSTCIGKELWSSHVHPSGQPPTNWLDNW